MHYWSYTIVFYDLYTTYIFLVTQIYNVWVTTAPLTEGEKRLYCIKKYS